NYAIRCDGPVAIRYPRARVPSIPWGISNSSASMGAEVLRVGDALLLLPVGSMVAVAMEAAERLSAQGVEVEVMDPAFVRPLDMERIYSGVSRHRAVVTVEEHVLSGGFGAGVAAAMKSAGLDGVRLVRLGVDDSFVPHGSREELLQDCGLGVDALVKVCNELLADAALRLRS
ncbi:MAG: 1-deoxy-D-xylulose-5-phosphate synthase, partial [Armatimonadetes bacterium]|nr:1-deoxy-D-xylulose-5-phosphate synthase [Armatimonadota bacterium]